MTLHKPSILEEEYFVRGEADKAAALKRAHAEGAAQQTRDIERQQHASHCPNCGTTMGQVTHGGLAVLRCASCCGVFLDAGLARQFMADHDEGYWAHMIRTLVGTGESL